VTKVLKALKIPIKPALGLSVGLPLVIKGEAKLTSKFSIEAKQSFTSGEKELEFAIKGIIPVPQTSFKMLKDEPFKAEKLSITPSEESASSELEAGIFAGVKPVVATDGIGKAKTNPFGKSLFYYVFILLLIYLCSFPGLADAAVGLYSGVQVDGKINLLKTLLPVVKSEFTPPMMIGCENCHKGEVDASIVAKEPFFAWKHFLIKETKKEELAKLDLRYEVLKMCLAKDPTVTPCIDKCCDNGVECFSSDGKRGTCGVASTGQCCKDSDCLGDEKCIERKCVKPCVSDPQNGYCCSNDDCKEPTPLCGGPDGHTCIPLTDCNECAPIIDCYKRCEGSAKYVWCLLQTCNESEFGPEKCNFRSSECYTIDCKLVCSQFLECQKNPPPVGCADEIDPLNTCLPATNNCQSPN